MRCDDDRPVHHLLRATATTSRDHLTRPPHATTTTFAIVHAHRSDVTSIHPSSAPPSSSSPRSVDRPTGTTPIEPIDRPFDRAVRSTVRSSRSTDRVHRSTDRVHPIPSHPIAQPYPSKYLEPMTVIGWRIHGVRHTSTTGTRPPPTPRACTSIALEGRDLACLYDSRLTTSPRPRHACAPFHRSRLDATTHVPRDRPRARAVGDATTSPRRHTRARVSYGPQTTRASDVRTEYTRTRALFTSTADARPIAR